jgi:hypothetical protein
MSSTNAPAKRFQFGKTEVSLWVNPTSDRGRLSFTLQRFYYRDKARVWTPYLRAENIADLHAIADQLQRFQQSLRRLD